MSDQTIGQLNPGAPAQGTDEVPIQRGSVNFSLTLDDIATYCNENAASSGDWSNTIFVDFSSGDDESTDIHNPASALKTLTAAVASATSGQTILIISANAQSTENITIPATSGFQLNIYSVGLNNTLNGTITISDQTVVDIRDLEISASIGQNWIVSPGTNPTLLMKRVTFSGSFTNDDTPIQANIVWNGGELRAENITMFAFKTSLTPGVIAAGIYLTGSGNSLVILSDPVFSLSADANSNAINMCVYSDSTSTSSTVNISGALVTSSCSQGTQFIAFSSNSPVSVQFNNAVFRAWPNSNPANNGTIVLGKCLNSAPVVFNGLYFDNGASFSSSPFPDGSLLLAETSTSTDAVTFNNMSLRSVNDNLPGSIGSGSVSYSIINNFGHFYASQISAYTSLPNNTVISFVGNASNTSGSDAAHIIEVGGTSGGNPYTSWVIPGGNSWTAGANNSDSGAYVVSFGSNLGTANAFRIAPSSLDISIAGNLGLATGKGIQMDISGPNPAAGTANFSSGTALVTTTACSVNAIPRAWPMACTGWVRVVNNGNGTFTVTSSDPSDSGSFGWDLLNAGL
jgi:hypothetical protein